MGREHTLVPGCPLRVDRHLFGLREAIYGRSVVVVLVAVFLASHVQWWSAVQVFKRVHTC